MSKVTFRTSFTSGLSLTASSLWFMLPQKSLSSSSTDIPRNRPGTSVSFLLLMIEEINPTA